MTLSLKSKWTLLISMFVITLAVALVIARGAESQYPPSVAPPDAPTLAALREAAGKVANTYGEEQPSNGRAVGTTRRALGELVATDVPFDDTVYVVVLHGKFTSSQPRPHGADAPTGRVLTVAFDPSTLEVADLLLTPAEPDVARLGDVVSLGP